jgi:hypothetical protein
MGEQQPNWAKDSEEIEREKNQSKNEPEEVKRIESEKGDWPQGTGHSGSMPLP